MSMSSGADTADLQIGVSARATSAVGRLKGADFAENRSRVEFPAIVRKNSAGLNYCGGFQPFSTSPS